jgi:HAD superfamily hydrolase (TIGR01549 family)
VTKPKAVVFDLDGTLLDSMTAAPAAYVETISSLGGPRVTAAEIVAMWHVGPASTVLCSFLSREISPDDIECYYRHLDQAITDLRAFAGVADMLDLLKRRRYKLGVYTAATRRAAALMLDVTGLSEFFSVLVGGDEVSQPKPAAEGILLACDRLRVSPTEIAYIGDTDLDLLCARNAGALGIQASWSGTGNPTRTSQACAQSPDEVPRLVRCPPASDRQD